MASARGGLSQTRIVETGENLVIERSRGEGRLKIAVEVHSSGSSFCGVLPSTTLPAPAQKFDIGHAFEILLFAICCLLFAVCYSAPPRNVARLFSTP
jgi:hypothetical protein